MLCVATLLCKKAIVAPARPATSSDGKVVVAVDDVDYSAIPSIRSFAPIVIPTRLFNGIERSTPGSKTQKIRIGHNTPLSVFDIPVYAVHMNASAAKQYQASWQPNLFSIAELPQLPENGFMAVGEAPSAPTKKLLPGPKNLYWELCREADLADEKKTLFGFEEPVSSNVSKYVPSAPLAPAEEGVVVVVADEGNELSSPFPDAELDLEDEGGNEMEDENRSDNNEISARPATSVVVAVDDVDYSAIPSIRSFAPIVIPTRLFNGIERSTPGSKTQKIRIGHNTPLSVFDIPVYAVHMNASAAKQYQASWQPNLFSIAELPQLPENGFMAVGEAPSAPTKKLLPGPKNLYWELCREADLADEKKTLFGFEEPVSSNVSKYVPSAPLAPAEEGVVVVVADEGNDLSSPFPDAELDLEDEGGNEMEDENRSDNNEISIVDETTPIVLRRSPRLAARRNDEMPQDVASSSELLGLVFLNGRRRSLRLMHRTC